MPRPAPWGERAASAYVDQVDGSVTDAGPPEAVKGRLRASWRTQRARDVISLGRGLERALYAFWRHAPEQNRESRRAATGIRPEHCSHDRFMPPSIPCRYG